MTPSTLRLRFIHSYPNNGFIQRYYIEKKNNFYFKILLPVMLSFIVFCCVFDLQHVLVDK